MIMPSRNHFEEYRWRVERSGCMTLHLGHRVGALELVEEAQVRHEGADEGEEYSEV